MELNVRHYRCLLKLCGAEFFTTGDYANGCPTCNCDRVERLSDKVIKVKEVSEFWDSKDIGTNEKAQ